MSRRYSLCSERGATRNVTFSACYSFEGLEKKKTQRAESGDIIAVSGLEQLTIGDTISSEENPLPLPRITVDEPTVSMISSVNNSPRAGLKGTYLTCRHLKARLQKEILGNVSLKVKECE